jgi:DNA-3-methyladenine glycosylase II
MPLTWESLPIAAARLARSDKDLGRLLGINGVPPLWARKPGFPTLIRIILEQQVSLASARAVFRRLAQGVAPFTPQRFAELGVSRLRSLGITRQKAAYCIQVAEAICERRLDLKVLGELDDPAAIAALTQVKGIGPWTADIYLLMALRRPDIWPAGDVALSKAAGTAKRLRRLPSQRELLQMAEAWRPFRAVAARILWHDYLRRTAERRRGA